MAHRPPEAVVIMNARAGRGAAHRLAERAAGLVSRRGMQTRVLATSARGEATELTHRYAADASLVIAVGGDGTASEVANGLMAVDPRPTLAVIPAGSACDLARNLGVCDAEEALLALSMGHTRAMDVGRVRLQTSSGPSTLYFLLTTGTGFSPWVIRCATPTIKRLFGARSYIVSGIVGAACYRPPAMSWRIDDQAGRGRVFNVVVANGAIEAGGAQMSPGASLFDGKLWVSVWQGGSSLAGLWRMRLIYSGRHVEHPAIRYGPAQTVTLESDPAVGIQVDGEVPGTTPATFDIIPAALQVVTGQKPVESPGR